MNTKLYVGNISWQFTEEELRHLFDEAGNVVSAQIIIDRDTGRSRGFGFVEMASVEDAEQALQSLNGMEVKGRSIVVKEALPEGRGGAKSSVDPIQGTTVIYIDSELHGEVKQLAKSSGKTIREITESAIETILRQEIR